MINLFPILLILPLLLCQAATITSRLLAQWSGISNCHEYLEFVHLHYSLKYCSAIESLHTLQCSSKNNSKLIDQALVSIIQSSLISTANDDDDDGNDKRSNHSNETFTNISLDMFHLTLSTHFHAPIIEAHYQYYSQYIKPSISSYKECENWIYLDKKQFCSFSDFKLYFER